MRICNESFYFKYGMSLVKFILDIGHYRDIAASLSFDFSFSRLSLSLVCLLIHSALKVSYIFRNDILLVVQCSVSLVQL